jgi:1-acyl-sn-glycerol-3-phosphate acyltransferase
MKAATPPAAVLADYPRPFAYQYQGSAWAVALLKLLGWRLYFDGFPTLQGVVIVYPHTSNWDAAVMFIAKWALGVPVVFWGKDSLFRLPLLGRWLRWIGGQPVNRSAHTGVVAQMTAHMQQCKARGLPCWLGLSPEGTRKRTEGWRSGFYQVAHSAQVPLCVAKLDYATRTITVLDFMALTGHRAHDMVRIGQVYAGARGWAPELAAPVQLNGAMGDSAQPQAPRVK